MGHIIKIVKSLQNSAPLIADTSETGRHEIKKLEGGFLPAIIAPAAASLIASMTSSLIQSVASSLINAIIGKGKQEKDKKVYFFYY